MSVLQFYENDKMQKQLCNGSLIINNVYQPRTPIELHNNNDIIEIDIRERTLLYIINERKKEEIAYLVSSIFIIVVLITINIFYTIPNFIILISELVMIFIIIYYHSGIPNRIFIYHPTFEIRTSKRERNIRYELIPKNKIAKLRYGECSHDYYVYSNKT